MIGLRRGCLPEGFLTVKAASRARESWPRVANSGIFGSWVAMPRVMDAAFPLDNPEGVGYETLAF